MFFVYKERNDRIEVIGGTVSVKAAKLMAERRAKRKLVWEQGNLGMFANISEGKLVTTYRIKEQERK